VISWDAKGLPFGQHGFRQKRNIDLLANPGTDACKTISYQLLLCIGVELISHCPSAHFLGHARYIQRHYQECIAVAIHCCSCGRVVSRLVPHFPDHLAEICAQTIYVGRLKYYLSGIYAHVVIECGKIAVISGSKRRQQLSRHALTP
jgi:hypothetical protein